MVPAVHLRSIRSPILRSALATFLMLAATVAAQRGSDEARRPAPDETTIAGRRLDARPWSMRSEVYGAHGMAATSQPLATEVALDVLKAGGSAVDAAIAANALLGLVEPTGSGIGGDLFAIVWDPETKRLHGLNASGRSPKSLTLEHLRERSVNGQIPPFGPLPISVPGCVDGWVQLHEKFGKLPFPEVLAPAIGYARDGAPISPVIAYYWSFGRRLIRYPGFGDVFLPGGRAPRAGELFRNEALANTLEEIAATGRASFYDGAIAEKIAAFLAEHGGFVTTEDLTAHRSEWVEPVSVNYRGYDVWELPPNGQGIAALQILQLLEPYDLRAAGFGSADHLHLFTEAKKLAFEDRARFYADPAFGEIPVAELISDEYASKRRSLLDRERAGRAFPPGNPALREGDTVFLTVADRDGMMVSLIQSNYRGFGSGMTPPDLGFCLQDRGQLFDLEPGRANTYAPGKRPFHTIIPTFITKDDVPWMSFGVMGGDMQPQGHAWIAINLIDFGMGLQEAGDAPRIRHDGSSSPTGERMTDGGTLVLEPGFSPEVVAELHRRGHRVESGDSGGFGGYQAIRRDPETGVYAGATEMRKDGNAAGY
jgi:gamma-glutamyltranspeptidase/glutathione hydrolase